MKYNNCQSDYYPFVNIGCKVELDDPKNQRYGQHATIINADRCIDNSVEYLIEFDDDTLGWFPENKINFL